MADIKLSDIHAKLPSEYFDSEGNPVDLTSQFKKTMEDLNTFLDSDSGRGVRNDLRTGMDRFVYKGGDIPAGQSNVNPLGTYIVGTKASNRSLITKIAQREFGERLFVDSTVDAVNSTLKSMEFKHNPEHDYSTRRDALIAHELESLSSKGPYDNGNEETALKTISAILEGADYKEPDDSEYWAVRENYYNYLYLQYKGNTETSRVFRSLDWVESMLKAGLSGTMRGLPYNAKGNAPVQKRHYDFMAWMLEPVISDFKYKRGTYEDFVREHTKTEKNDVGGFNKIKPTVDDHIQAVMYELIEVRKLLPTQIINMRMLLSTTISRNQGSPWEVEFLEDYEVTGKRKDMKYRAVVPAPALPQAILLLSTRGITKAAPSLKHRIGLQDPTTNESRFNSYIRNHATRSQVGISTDFSSYDIKLWSKYMAETMMVYEAALDDVVAKDAMRMGAILVTQKIAFFPTYPNNDGHPYANAPYEYMYKIKGQRSFNIKKAMSQTTSKEMREKLADEAEKFDYVARAFYIFKSWLISGVIVTNTVGSDCTTLYEGWLVPHYLFLKGLITIEERDAMQAVIASGDDAVSAVPKRLYDAIGYEGVLKLLEEANLYFNMIVNPKKQLKVKYKGYPVYDFLQQVKLPMWESVEEQPPYRKFIRQWMAVPFNERESKLDFVFQNVSPIGKLESGLCEENLEFAANVIVNAGKIMKERAREKGYQPPVPPNMYGSRDKLYWDKQYAVNNSELCGFGQLIGLVKKYGQNTISALGKYLALEHIGDAVNEIESELETRAPHRANIAASIFANLGAEAFHKAGGMERFNATTAVTHWYFVDLLSKVDEMTGRTVQEVVLEKQETLTSIPVDVETDDAEDLQLPDENLNVGEE